MSIPKTHPRYDSLMLRERLKTGVEAGITSVTGLIAHGRGEAFDYLLGEKTHPFAAAAAAQAVALFQAAKHPILSVNGNVAALCPAAYIALSEALSAPIEVNLFHYSAARVAAIVAHLKSFGAQKILTPNPQNTVPGLASARRFVASGGTLKADVMLVPLEDGDRTEMLKAMGKTVITIDLNPLSRTAKTADITIVDNVCRALPMMLSLAKKRPKISPDYDNRAILQAAISSLRGAC